MADRYFVVWRYHQAPDPVYGDGGHVSIVSFESRAHDSIRKRLFYVHEDHAGIHALYPKSSNPASTNDAVALWHGAENFASYPNPASSRYNATGNL